MWARQAVPHHQTRCGSEESQAHQGFSAGAGGVKLWRQDEVWETEGFGVGPVALMSLNLNVHNSSLELRHVLPGRWHDETAIVGADQNCFKVPKQGLRCFLRQTALPGSLKAGSADITFSRPFALTLPSGFRQPDDIARLPTYNHERFLEPRCCAFQIVGF